MSEFSEKIRWEKLPKPEPKELKPEGRKEEEGQKEKYVLNHTREGEIFKWISEEWAKGYHQFSLMQIARNTCKLSYGDLEKIIKRLGASGFIQAEMKKNWVSIKAVNSDKIEKLFEETKDGRIYNLIKGNPGINIYKIRKTGGLDQHVAEESVRNLISAGLIEQKTMEKKRRCFFPKGYLEGKTEEEIFKEIKLIKEKIKSYDKENK